MSKYSPKDEARLRLAIYERSEIRAKQELQWVQTLVAHAGQVAAEGLDSSGAAITVFWIRLYGLLAEIAPKYEYLSELGADREIQHVRDACLTVQEALSEDELIYLTYRRDTEAHVWQHQYDLRGEAATGKLKERRKIALLDRVMMVDDISQRVANLIRPWEYRGREAGIAVDFARRVEPLLREVLAALERLHRPA